MTEYNEMMAALEAILFVTAEPVPRDKLLEVFNESDAEEAGKAVDEILARYSESGGRGVVLEEVAGGLRLITRPELNGYLRKFFEVTGRTKLSMAALETLAIVAYRQPISGPEIQELRGVASGGVLRTLLERRLIRVAGRKPVVGKPFLYRTTRDFLMHFGLESVDDLPPLEEFEERFGVLGDPGEQLDLSEGEDVAEMEASLVEVGPEPPSEESLAEESPADESSAGESEVQELQESQTEATAEERVAVAANENGNGAEEPRANDD